MDFITIVLPRQRSGSGFNIKRNFAQPIENVMGINPWFILLAMSGLSITMGAFGISGINGWLSVLRGTATVQMAEVQQQECTPLYRIFRISQRRIYNMSLIKVLNEGYVRNPSSIFQNRTNGDQSLRTPNKVVET
ncbi:hypothetical protein ACFOLF_26260 [Paenibacillus sepulcri]|uniref:Uncharacterized protein n=1 Tax=Paenibacillus sepulcri TaxID=359917 RepID=A0ABS7BYN6_9BACL|nr:hypothetical protein [Paenibacillus sepulcri]